MKNPFSKEFTTDGGPLLAPHCEICGLVAEPWWFVEFLAEIVAEVEPRAQPFYAECRDGGWPGPGTLAENLMRNNRTDVWATGPDRESRREHLLNVARIADGAEFTSAADEMQRWREHQQQKAAATTE